MTYDYLLPYPLTWLMLLTLPLPLPPETPLRTTHASQPTPAYIKEFRFRQRENMP